MKELGVFCADSRILTGESLLSGTRAEQVAAEVMMHLVALGGSRDAPRVASREYGGGLIIR